jgi:hypothetical protein
MSIDVRVLVNLDVTIEVHLTIGKICVEFLQFAGIPKSESLCQEGGDLDDSRSLLPFIRLSNIGGRIEL